MSISSRLARLERELASHTSTEGAVPHAALVQLRDTFPTGVQPTLELVTAIGLAICGRVPEWAGKADCYLRAEHRAALATWRASGASGKWHVWPTPTDSDRRIAYCFCADWCAALELGEQWKRTGNLAEGSPERTLYADTCERGSDLWQWGGWNYQYLPPDWIESPYPHNLVVPILAALVEVLQQ